jgi:magnesium-transporting ATPase (P-type)
VPGGINWTCRWWRRGRGKGVILCLVGYDGTKYGEGRCTFLLACLLSGVLCPFFSLLNRFLFLFLSGLLVAAFSLGGMGCDTITSSAYFFFVLFYIFNKGQRERLMRWINNYFFLQWLSIGIPLFFLLFFLFFFFVGWGDEEGDDGIGYQ